MKTMKKIALLLMFFCVIKFSTAQINSCATDEVRDFIRHKLQNKCVVLWRLKSFSKPLFQNKKP